MLWTQHLLSLDLLRPAGKSEKITIKNDKGRLSEEEIERMVKEAEDFAEQVGRCMP